MRSGPTNVGANVYSLQASEVEYIGKSQGTSFGSKAVGRQHGCLLLVRAVRARVKAPTRCLYYGDTHATIIPEVKTLTGNAVERVLLGRSFYKGYCGHALAPDDNGRWTDQSRE